MLFSADNWLRYNDFPFDFYHVFLFLPVEERLTFRFEVLPLLSTDNIELGERSFLSLVSSSEVSCGFPLIIMSFQNSSIAAWDYGEKHAKHATRESSIRHLPAMQWVSNRIRDLFIFFFIFLFTTLTQVRICESVFNHPIIVSLPKKRLNTIP